MHKETGGEAKASVVGKLYARHGGAEHKALWMGHGLTMTMGFESLGGPWPGWAMIFWCKLG